DYSAEYGDATAGVITATTKSGSNQVHGSAFEYHRSGFGQARDPFANAKGSVPPSVYNQFGGSLGGPIRKDKTFIFGDYQGSRQRNGESYNYFVPDAAEKGGDLSGLSTNIFDPFGANGAILTPANRTQFAGNMIPTGMLSPQAQKLLALLPTGATETGSAPNFFSSGSLLFDTNNFDVKVDQYQTDKLHLFGRYTFQQYLMTGPGAFGEELGGPNPTAAAGSIRYAGDSSSRDQSLASGFDYTVSPNLLTDFRFAFFRYRVIDNPNGLNTTPATDAGIPGLNVSAITGGMPAFFINGTGGFSFGYGLGVNGCNCPLNQQEQQFQFVDNWTYIHGNHTVEFGTDLRHLQNLRVPSDQHRAGEVSFSACFTEGPEVTSTGTSIGGGLGLAAFLLGDVTNFDRYVSTITDAAERQNREFFFGQDTWRITPKLSFNYGLRWEIYNPQYVNGAGNGAWLNVGTGETLVAGQNGIGLNGNVQNDYKNFGPRAGIAYQINDKTVLRLGYGRFFDSGVFGTTFGHTVTQNLPVLGSQSVQPANSYQDVFTLTAGPPAFNPTTALQSSAKAPDGNFIYPAGVTPKILPRKMILPTVDAWNVTLQREITPNASLSVAWVGNKGTHVFVGDGPCYNINQRTIAGFTNPALSGNDRQPFFNKIGPNGQPLGWFQSVAWYGGGHSNNYESLQAVFN
ncbi:MAG: TonB-dependent receptor domain-containing protein, partial [Terriglobia bacterium]